MPVPCESERSPKGQYPYPAKVKEALKGNIYYDLGGSLRRCPSGDALYGSSWTARCIFYGLARSARLLAACGGSRSSRCALGLAPAALAGTAARYRLAACGGSQPVPTFWAAPSADALQVMFYMARAGRLDVFITDSREALV